MGRKERRERGFLTLFPPKRWEIGRTYFSYKRYPFAKNYRHSCVQSFGAPTDEISPRYDFRLSQLLWLICLIAWLKHEKKILRSLWNYWPVNIFLLYFLFLFFSFFFAVCYLKNFCWKEVCFVFWGTREKVFKQMLRGFKLLCCAIQSCIRNEFVKIWL